VARTPPRGSVRFLNLEDTFYTSQNNPHTRIPLEWSPSNSDTSTEKQMSQSHIPEYNMEEQPPLQSFATLRQDGGGWGNTFSAHFEDERAAPQETRTAPEIPRIAPESSRIAQETSRTAEK